jgi:hypothetical protein
MADSADTTAERTRCRNILTAALSNPTPANIRAAKRAVANGTAAESFPPPDPLNTVSGGAA